MTFLKKLGTILIKASAMIAGIAPLFPQYDKYTGKAVDTLAGVIDVIVGVEAFGQVLNIPGPDKLKAAAPLVANIIIKSDLLVGKKIKNQALFNSGVTKMTDGMVEILNSIDENEVKEESIN